MTKHLIALAVLASVGLSAQAAISIDTPAFTYGQSFDTLTTSTTAVTWTNDSTLLGWSLFTAAGTPIATYLAGTGAGNTGSYYSFGASGSTDRALGSVGAGGAYYGSPASGAVAGYSAVAFSNDTGAALSAFTLNFAGEQWRNGGNSSAQTMVLQYGFGTNFSDVTTWTAPGGNFDFTSPVFNTTAAAVDGNTAGRVNGLGGTVNTSWAAGTTLWVRWVETNDVGNDHGLAIDNFGLSVAVSAVPEPGALSMLLAGVAVVAFVARRQRA